MHFRNGLFKMKTVLTFIIVLIFTISSVVNACQQPFGSKTTSFPTIQPDLKLPEKVYSIKTKNGLAEINAKRLPITSDIISLIKPKPEQYLKPLNINQLVENSLEQRKKLSGTEVKYHVNFETAKPLAPITLAAESEDPKLKIMGVWKPESIKEPEHVLLRWTPNPQKAWISNEGFNLYRIIGGQSQLIGSGIGSQSWRNEKLQALDKKFIHENDKDATSKNDSMIQALSLEDLVQKSFITPVKLNGIKNRLQSESIKLEGQLTEDKLRELIYKPDNLYDKQRMTKIISGKENFNLQFRNTFLYPKISDPYTQIPKLQKENINQSIKSDNEASNEKSLKSNPVFAIKEIREIKEAQKAILTASNIDSEFAEGFGLSYKDKQISSLGLKKDTKVEYKLVSIVNNKEETGNMSSVTVIYGIEKLPAAPANLEGYGANKKVFLRWETPYMQTPSDKYSKSVITGYIVERKKASESVFTPLNETEPVVIGYMENGEELNEPGIFFIDEDVENDKNNVISYRVCAVDIFGQKTKPSNEIDVIVAKTLSPPTPGLQQPYLITEKQSLDKHEALTAIEINEILKDNTSSGIFKIIVPFSHSLQFEEINDIKNLPAVKPLKPDSKIIRPLKAALADVAGYKIYRSKALGNGDFTYPPEAKYISLNNEGINPAYGIPIVDKNNIMLPNDCTKSVLYNDNDVEPGYFYKYWISAVDSWGNESYWSESKIIGYPLKKAPEAPKSVLAEFIVNNDLKKSLAKKIVPGFENTRYRLNSSINKDNSEIRKATEAKQQSKVNSTDTKINNMTRREIVYSKALNNLPENYLDVKTYNKNQTHTDGSLVINWMAYSGKDPIEGYAVYCTNYPTEQPDQFVLDNLNWISTGFSERNQYVQTLPRPDTSEFEELADYLYFMIVPVYEKDQDSITQLTDGKTAANVLKNGGNAAISWNISNQDPQIKYYRVYRAEKEDDISKLQWSLVGDNIYGGCYYEGVDQSKAHDYYYRVASVNVWGMESSSAYTAPLHIPTTIPPAAPQLLMPKEDQGLIKVKWKTVADAAEYRIYRKIKPEISVNELMQLQTIKQYIGEIPMAFSSEAILKKVFTGSLSGNLITNQNNIALKQTAKLPEINNNLSIEKLQIPNFDITNSKKQLDIEKLNGKIASLTAAQKQQVYNEIYDKYGVLALSPYGLIDQKTASEIEWGDPIIIKAENNAVSMEYNDYNVEYGTEYLYAVSAVNSDKLESATNQPISATPLKSNPPPAPDYIATGSTVNGPHLTWSQYKPKVENTTFGYIVFRGCERDGIYHQISPLLSKPEFLDISVENGREFWYKIRIIDEAGLLSDFSIPIKLGRLSITVPKIDMPLKNQLPIINQSPTIIQNKYPTISPSIKQAPLFTNSMTVSGFYIDDIQQISTKEGSHTIGNLSLPGLEDISVKLQDSQNVLTKQKLRVNLSGLYTSKIDDSSSNITFTELQINDGESSAKVSGKLQIPKLYSLGSAPELVFENARMTFDPIKKEAVISVDNCPGLQIDEYILKNITSYKIVISNNTQLNKVVFEKGTMEMSLGLITIDNQGLELDFENAEIDYFGNISSVFSSSCKQLLKLVVPKELMLAVSPQTALAIKNGVIIEGSSKVSGNVIMPFYQAGELVTYPDGKFEFTMPSIANQLPVKVNPNIKAPSPSVKSPVPAASINSRDLKALKTAAASKLSDKQLQVLDSSLLYTINSMSQSSYDSIDIQTDKLLEIPFAINNAWSGKGFIVSLKKQNMPAFFMGQSSDIVQKFKLSSNTITIDLSASESPENRPANTDEAWLGLVFEDVKIGLPMLIKDSQGKKVSINMEQEVYYDINGIRCEYAGENQTRGSNTDNTDSEKDIKLAGFKGKLQNVQMSIYANKIKAEFLGRISVPVLNNQYLQYSFLVDDKQCTNAINIIDGSLDTQNSLTLSVTGGRLEARPIQKNDKDGNAITEISDSLGDLYLDGDIDIDISSQASDDDGCDFKTLQTIEFYDLKLPSEWPYDISEIDNDNMLLYGFSMLSKPSRAVIGNNDFNMQLKSIRFNKKGDLKLSGAITLADNLPINKDIESDDVIILQPLTNPHISVNENGIYSKLVFTYEDIVNINLNLYLRKSMESYEFYVDSEDVEEECSDFLETYNDTASVVNSPSNLFNFDFGMDIIDIPLEIPTRIQALISKNYWAMKLNVKDDKTVKFGPFALDDTFEAIILHNLNMPADASLDLDKWIWQNTEKIHPGNSCLKANNINMMVSDLLSVKQGNIYIASGPVLEISGELYLKDESLDMDMQMGKAIIGYYHPGTFITSVSFSEIQAPFFGEGYKMSGSLGFTAGSDTWSIAIGYPDIIKIKTPDAMRYGLGLAFECSTDNDSAAYLVKAKAMVGAEADVDISIIYLKASIEAEAEIIYLYSGDSSGLELLATIRGNGCGGIKVGKKKYDIIKLALELVGKMKTDFDSYYLQGNAKIRYHLDLFLVSYSGSEEWEIEYGNEALKYRDFGSL